MNSRKQAEKIAAKLIKLSHTDALNKLAEIEISKDETTRKTIELEYNLLRREQQYEHEAEMYYEEAENKNSYPDDYKHYSVIKKKIFQKVKKKYKSRERRGDIDDRQNKKLVEKLLLYRIKHEPAKTMAHLIPDSMKNVKAAVTHEAERLYELYLTLRNHNNKHPTSHRYGMTPEEKDMLKKIRSGYFEKKIGTIKQRKGITKTVRKRNYEKAKDNIKDKIKDLPKSKREIAEKLVKETWYRKESLSDDEITLLKDLGYQETNRGHPVYDFEGKLVACVAYKPSGFKHRSYKNDRRETLHHYSRPFLLKQLIPSVKILVPLALKNGETRTIDATLKTKIDSKTVKIAFEFQESHKIGAERVLAKVKPILEEYDILIAIRTEAYKKVYEPIKDERFYGVNNAEFTSLLEQWGILPANSGT